jgi:hypothetical protein
METKVKRAAVFERKTQVRPVRPYIQHVETAVRPYIEAEQRRREREGAKAAKENAKKEIELVLEGQ